MIKMMIIIIMMILMIIMVITMMITTLMMVILNRTRERKFTHRGNCQVEALFGESFSRTCAEAVTEREGEEASL